MELGNTFHSYLPSITLITSYFIDECIKPHLAVPFSIEFTLPQSDYFPSALLKQVIVSVVSFNIVFYLLFPKVSSGFGQFGSLTPLVSMPKTPVSEYYCVIFRKNNIRLTRKRGVIFPKSESLIKKCFPCKDFQLTIPIGNL